MIVKRAEVARILGYESFSKFVLEDRMAKLPANVEKFQEDLAEKIMSQGRKEFLELEKLKKDELNDASAKLKPEDKMYYSNLQKEKFYQVDEEAIKAYFPTTHVVTETMAIYQELFGLNFTKVDAPVWHEDVECFQVTDNENG